MSFLIGPDSGDMAFGDGTWARVEAATLGSPIPLIFIDDSQFPAAEDFGLLTADQNPSGAWEQLDSLAVDVSSRHEIDIYDVRKLPDPRVWDSKAVVQVAGTVFPDPHPETWWRDVHDKTGRIGVFVGPLKRHLEPGNKVSRAFVKDARFGVCYLVVRAYEAGIGTHPPAAN